MLSRFSARLRATGIDYRLLVPVLGVTALVQIVTAVVRITTSYRAVELELSIVWLGAIAAAFALFPILMAVSVGRFIDRGHDALTIWTGSVIMAATSAAFTVWSTAAGLLVVTALLGIGHIMLLASQQMLCVRAAGHPRNMDAVFGNYMVAGALGQGIGPYVVGWAGGDATVPPTQFLFATAAAFALLSLAIALAIRRGPPRPKPSPDERPVPLSALLRVPGLIPVVAAGVIMISASDVILIYTPLLGAERNIDVRDIGLLLTVRAVASMVARFFYARLVGAIGHWPLMIGSTAVCAMTFAAFAMPVPLVWLYVIMAVMGFSFGIATTLSITMVVDITAPGAKGTANTLRIMGNRIGQFVLPFGAGLIAAAIGLSGLLLGIAAAIGAAAAALQWKRPVKPAPD